MVDVYVYGSRGGPCSPATPGQCSQCFKVQILQGNGPGCLALIQGSCKELHAFPHLHLWMNTLEILFRHVSVSVEWGTHGVTSGYVKCPQVGNRHLGLLPYTYLASKAPEQQGVILQNNSPTQCLSLQINQNSCARTHSDTADCVTKMMSVCSQSVCFM